jgi:5'-nucleotidase
MLTSSNGIKVGVIGLVEREWLDTINSLPPDLVYKSASAVALELVPMLREQGAEIVVAVTHMREPNDIKLATNKPPGFIDIILGGHDHYYNHQVVNGTHILRSGSDFRQLSYIEARRKNDSDQQWSFNIIRRDITREIPEDPPTVSLIERLTSNLKAKLEMPMGHTTVPLDGRFTTVRRAESNLGNFICDLMRFYYTTDCAIMAAGTIRGDQVYPPGVLKIRDIMNCFPFEDPVICLRVTGSAIVAALENGVSKLPALEGRFPQVSNIVFEFDISLPAGNRIIRASIDGRPIEPEKKYLLATRGYMGRGKDGYSSLLIKSAGGEAEEVVDEENGLLISTIVRQYFMGLKVISQWGRWGKRLDRVWGGVVEKMSKGGCIHEPHHTPPENNAEPTTSSFPVDIDSDTDDHSTRPLPTTLDDEPSKLLIRKYTKKWLVAAGISSDGISLVDGVGGVAGWTKGISPKLEGRIAEGRPINPAVDQTSGRD